MPQFMIVLILYISLLNLSWIKKYWAFKYVNLYQKPRSSNLNGWKLEVGSTTWSIYSFREMKALGLGLVKLVWGLVIHIQQNSPFNRLHTTVDSHYIKDQGTPWNTLRYPYLDISDLQKWGKNKSNNHISQISIICEMWLFDLFLLLRSNFSFPQYFVICC